MNAASSRRLYNIAAVVLLAFVGCLWLRNLWDAQHHPLNFDDAYMFARYAANIRHGLGLSWNLDGAHTYGETAPLWGIVVLGLSYLPLAPWNMLTLGSWLCSILAVAGIAWACAANARSEFLSSTWRVLPLVVLPLADTPIFIAHQVNGMETMLATLLVGVFAGLALRWRRGSVRSELLAVAGLLLFLARPEAALAVVMLPLSLHFLLPGPALPKRSALTFFAVFFAGILLDLLACKLYFHTALPLSFYMKSRHGYEGYRSAWHPELFLLDFFAGCKLYLVVLVLFARRADWRLIACFFVPALIVFAYLGTVTQIMGYNARYYFPYLAFIIVPALLVVDRWVAAGVPTAAQWPRNSLLLRSAAAVILMAGLMLSTSQTVQTSIRRMEARQQFVYEPARLEIAAHAPLPEQGWGETTAAVTDRLLATLPAGSTVAATEVGYLGSRAPAINVIDLAGLNDTDIALHGFDAERLLKRKPDVIWMPHTDYTWQRGLLLSDPRLLAEYNVYAQAAGYGIAIRKDSPFRAQIDGQIQSYWNSVYPGYSMADYLVRSASWSGRKFKVTGD